MDPVASSRFSAGQIGVTLTIGSVALLMLGLQPILLGELANTHLITLNGVGIVATGEILALGLGVALSDALLPVSRHKQITSIAALLAAAVDLATLHATGDSELVALRAAAGLPEGVLLWAATSVIVRSVNAERLAANFIAVQTMAQAGVLALLAVVVIPLASWEGSFGVLALLTGLCAVLAAWLPPGLVPLQTKDDEHLRWTVPRILALVIALLHMATVVSLFAYLEPLALAVGLNSRGAEFLTSGVLVMQIVGGIAATRAVQRFATVPTLAVGSVVLATVAVGIRLLPAGAALPFTLLCAVLGFTWLFLMPFQISLAFRADSKGRVALLIPAAQLVGSALGPLFASLTVRGDDARTVPLVSLGFALCAAVLVTAGRRLWVKTDALIVEGLPALQPLEDPEPAK